MTLSENWRTLTCDEQPPYMSRLFFSLSLFLLLEKTKQHKTKTTQKQFHWGNWTGSLSSSIDFLVIYSLMEGLMIASLLLHSYCLHSSWSTWEAQPARSLLPIFFMYIMINGAFIVWLLGLIFASCNQQIVSYPSFNPNKWEWYQGGKMNNHTWLILYIQFDHLYAYRPYIWHS